LIAGCGYVGCALGIELAEAGHEVFGLRRDPTDLPAAIRGIAADLSQVDALAGIPDGLDFVFYLASAGGGGDEAYRAVYIDGVGSLLDAMRQQGVEPRRFFFASSTSVYGQSRGEWVDEASPTRPTSFRGDLLLCGERLALASKIPTTVVRLGGIYGPGRDRLIRGVAKRRVRTRKGQTHFTNRIHRDDAAGLFHHLMERDSVDDLYLGVDMESAEESELLSWMAERLGVGPLEDAPADSPAEMRRAGSKRCRNTRLLESGYAFRYPSFREGYGAML
jgi:nucleoside-diphosphate-sugar epimerase